VSFWFLGGHDFLGDLVLYRPLAGVDAAIGKISLVIAVLTALRY
jgi:hypothetical protein